MCSHCDWEHENPEEEEEMTREEMEKELLEILAERGREFLATHWPKEPKP